MRGLILSLLLMGCTTSESVSPDAISSTDAGPIVSCQERLPGLDDSCGVISTNSAAFRCSVPGLDCVYNEDQTFACCRNEACSAVCQNPSGSPVQWEPCPSGAVTCYCPHEYPGDPGVQVLPCTP